jgi:serine protease Do
VFSSPCFRTRLNATAMLLATTLYPCMYTAVAAPLPTNKEARTASANTAMQIDLPGLVERYGAAVVNITAITSNQQPPALAPIDTDDPFAPFFKRATPAAPAVVVAASGASAPATVADASSNTVRTMWGSGSGFIVSSDGLVMTTAHVVDSAEEVMVTLVDKRQFKAKVLIVEPQYDVALLKIDATKLPTVKLGDSSRVRAGEPVLTIGSPYSFENTVSFGIVSATSRALPDGGNFPFFQTNVSTNPDNSGGPIFNRLGEVIGIHAQIYADSDRYQNSTFAIPINLATKVRLQLQAQPKASRAGLGIDVQDIDPGLAAAFGVPHAAGALVTAVESGTPGATSTIKPGDVVVQAGDQPIERAADFVERLSDVPAGSKITLKLIRNRKPVTVAIGQGVSDDELGSRQGDANLPDRLGLAARPMTPAELRANRMARGLIVDGVAGPAAIAGIQPGDIVLSLNGTPARSQRQVSALAAKSGKQIALLIQRDNTRSFVSLELK